MPEQTGIHQVRVDSSISLTHSHILPPQPKTLIIKSGANSIKWHYTLNTSVKQTIGGEVTQILSSYVGPMIIEGLASSNEELKSIRDWFMAYMELAGTAYQDHWFRDEMAAYFKYPARGWSFLVMPTDFQGFRYDKTLYAIPWQATMEIVSDSAINYLSGVTMTAFTGPLANPAFIQVGYSDPTGSGKASMFVNPLLSADIPQLANTMGDNFHRLVASFSSGNFENFAFGNLLSTNNNLPKDVVAQYIQAYGSPNIVSGQNSGDLSQTTGLGSITLGTIANPSNQQQIIQDIAAEFYQADVPSQLGLAVSLQETGGTLDPNSRNPNDGGPGVDGVGLFQVHYGGRVSSAEVKAASVTDRTNPVTKNYPAGDQISDAAGWFPKFKPNPFTSTHLVDQMAEWAQAAQGSANTYFSGGSATATFQRYWNDANTYLQAAGVSGNALTIVGTARSQLGITEQPIGSNSGPQVDNYIRSVGLNPPEPWCAAFTYWVFQQVLGGGNPLPQTGSVSQMYLYAKQQGWLTSNPSPACLAFFTFTSDGAPFPNHVGIVTGSGASPTVISGNYANAVSTEAAVDSQYITAYAQPPIPASKVGA